MAPRQAVLTSRRAGPTGGPGRFPVARTAGPRTSDPADRDEALTRISPRPRRSAPSAPRFGGFGDEQGGGGGVASEGRHDQQQGIADGDAGPTIGKALRTIIPVVVIVIVALVFFRSDFSLWWVVFVFVLPMLRRLGDMFRDNDRRR
jgi:hypothetical protein